MRLRLIAQGLLGRPTLRLLAGLPALLLLLPVPALALTFTSSWQAVVSTSGGPTPPTPTFSDVTNKAEQVDNLSIDMGAYKGSTASASSTIELTRNISLTQGQDVEFEYLLRAGFQNAGADVTVGVKDAAGKTVVTPIDVDLKNTSDKMKTIRDFEEAFSRLKKGNYTLDVKVKFFTNNKVGGWKSISAHHELEFEGED